MITPWVYNHVNIFWHMAIHTNGTDRFNRVKVVFFGVIYAWIMALRTYHIRFGNKFKSMWVVAI